MNRAFLLIVGVIVAGSSLAWGRSELITPEELRTIMGKAKPPVAVIDVRSRREFEAKHIEGASHIPSTRIVQARLPKDGALVLYCTGEGCSISGEAADKLRAEGHANVRVLEGGILAWEAQGFPIVARQQGPDFKAPVARIAPKDLREMIGSSGLVIVDVRPESEYKAGHLPGARSVPLEELGTPPGGLSAETEVVVYDRDLKRSREAAHRLVAMGYRVKELKGGIQVWSAMKLPLEM